MENLETHSVAWKVKEVEAACTCVCMCVCVVHVHVKPGWYVCGVWCMCVYV